MLYIAIATYIDSRRISSKNFSGKGKGSLTAAFFCGRRKETN